MTSTSNSIDVNSFGSLLSKIKWLVDSNFNAALRNHGVPISPEQWALLIAIRSNQGLHQGELAAKVYKDKTNVTRIVDKLAEYGLVERQAYEGDRRKYSITLTEKGLATVNNALPCALSVNEKALAPLT